MQRQRLSPRSGPSLWTTLVAILISLLIGFAAFINTNRSAVSAQAAVVQSTSPIPGFARSLETIRGLLDRGRGIEAENVARVLLARVESIRGPDALEVAEVLDLLWRAVRRSSKVKEEEKREIVERAVAIKEKTLGPTHPDLATSLINLGVQRTLAGDPAAATPLIERALAIREAAFGPDHVSVADALIKLGGLLITLHDDEGAKVLLERAQRIRETVYGVGHPDTIRTLVNLAILYQETGDYTGARLRYERALVLCEKIRGPADPLKLHVLTSVAVVLSELGGDFAGSARLNERLLALTEQSFGPTDRRLRTPLENLAMDLRDLGDYAAAKALAERSLAIAERALGPKHAEVAQSLHTLATIFAGLGDYAEAMRLFERATQINEEVLRPANPESARASWFIRDLFPLSGYGPDEVDLFERVLAIREQCRGLGDPRTAESLSNLAAALSSADDYRRTRPLFERALEAQESFLGPDHPEVAAAATNLANVLSRTGDYDAARRFYERALSNWEKSLGADHPKVATALVNLARLHLTTGNYHEAGPLLARALAIQEKGLGPEHPDVAVTLSSQAELAAHTGARIDAFATASRAEALSREHLRLTVRTLPERQALAYASSRASALDLMLGLASTRSGDSQMSTAAWDAVIRARGMVLDEVAARHRSASAGEAREIASLAEALASARQRLAALTVRGIRNDPPERYRRLLEQARDEKERAERALAENSAKFRNDQSRSRILLPEVSGALPGESALVGFVRYLHQDLERSKTNTTPRPDAEPSYLAFLLCAGDRVPAVVPLGSAARIDRLILQWRQQLDQEAMAAGRAAKRGEAAYRRVAGELRQQIWDPLLPHLSNATRVFIVPDGALHLVSFAALPTALSRYLVETGPVIHYLSAERDLVSTGASAPAVDGLLAVGDPAFDESSPAPVASQASFRGARSTCRDFQSMRFDALPDSLKELNEVVTLWKQAHGAWAESAALPSTNASRPDILRLTGAAASESAFKSAAAGHRILHLATHGFFLGGRCASALDPSATATTAGASAKIARENPLLLSGLALAGANHRQAAGPDEDDGILTAEEIAALNLEGVEWAVLSGCDTGIGEVRAGEGVFGLRRAFQVAGARTVIMSLWPVEDNAARGWMTTLYRQRFTKGLSTADSVREASLKVLRERRARSQSTHPFYWAGFVAAGDWH
jgi:CHAT domain-containing protein/tetratricopeptide (TPR) repeat protein